MCALYLSFSSCHGKPPHFLTSVFVQAGQQLLSVESVNPTYIRRRRFHNTHSYSTEQTQCVSECGGEGVLRLEGGGRERVSVVVCGCHMLKLIKGVSCQHRHICCLVACLSDGGIGGLQGGLRRTNCFIRARVYRYEGNT